MIETKEFSYDLIYDQVQDFCLSKGITKISFRLSRPMLVHQYNLVNNLTLEEGHAFGVNSEHPAWNDFVKYLEDKHSFESKISSIIQDYDDFFNHAKDDECYNEYAYYFINSSGHIQKVHVFEFKELQFGDYHMSLFEVNDSDMDDFENKVRDYYLEYFGKPLPDELKKPFATLSTEELELVRMICI